jgi:hypothetical protein
VKENAMKNNTLIGFSENSLYGCGGHAWFCFKQWSVYQSKRVLIVMILMLAACDKTGEEAEVNTPDDTMVRIEINDHKFNVPVRYTYKYSKEKWGRVREPKSERVSVVALELDVLLPDLRPYYEEDDKRWNVKGHGDRVSVTIRKPVGGDDWYEWLYKHELEFVGLGRYVQESDIYGLARFDEGPSVRHFPLEGKGITIACDKSKPNPSFFPGCKAKSEYSNGIVIDYYYGLEHLSRWKEIDDGLKVMFDGFANNAVKE